MAARDLAAEIAANYAGNADSPEEVMGLLQDSYNMLLSMDGSGSMEGQTAGTPTEGDAGAQKLEPVMDPQKAIGNDKIACLVCGKSFKTLKRHLGNAHDMTPEQYREAFGLSKDYPLVAPNLSEQRRQVAKDRGLGERLAEARRQQREEGQG